MIPQPHGAPPHRGRRRSLALVGATAALVGVIALLGTVFFGPETSTPAISAPSAQPMPRTDQPVETPSPILAPVGVATPTAEPTQATPKPPPSPTAAPPSEPVWYTSIDMVGDVSVAIDSDGVWTRTASDQAWTMTPLPDPRQRTWCRATVDGEIAFVSKNTVSWFSPTLPGWLNERTESLPSLGIDGGTSAHESYCHVLIRDGRLILGAASDQAIVFAVEQIDGTFARRAVAYPAHFTTGERPSFWEVRTLRHGDRIVVDRCSYYTDTGCLSTHFSFDSAVVSVDGPAELSWEQAGGSQILPSAASDVTVFADLGGSISRGFDLIQIGDEVWTIELTERLGSTKGPDFSSPVGVWSAGPLDTAPALVGTGYRALLSVYGGEVIASMFPLGEPEQSGPWNSQPADPDAVDQEQLWWSFDRATDQWQALDGNPDGPTIPDPNNPPIWPQLAWSTDESNRPLPEAPSQGSGSWEAIVAHRRPVIVGERAFSHDSQWMSVSNDRGASWTAETLLAWGPGRDFCSSASGTGFAYFADNEAVPAAMIIESRDSTTYIDWPVQPRVYSGDQGARPCRPLRMDNRWWIGEIDHSNRTLHIMSTQLGDVFSHHTIDLSELDQAALPGGPGLGTVHLYNDAGRIVVQVCRSGDGYPCVQSAATSIDSRLLVTSGPEGTHHYAPQDVAMQPVVEVAAFRQFLHQVGDELWQVEINEEGDPLPFDGDARLGRYGQELERLSGQWVDVRLRYGKIMRCVYEIRYYLTPPTVCETLEEDDTWQPVLGTIAVDWATVPDGTPVTFFARADDGTILVVPS